MGNADIIASFAIVLLAAAVHASFQLSISVLTLLSGHALGRKSAQHRLLRLVGGFVTGVAIITVLLLTFVAFVLSIILPTTTHPLIWAGSCGALIGVGISVWMFYYRDKSDSTSLWVPRGFANYLGNRSKASKVTAEAFGLGMTSVIGELLFIFAPLIVAALVLIRLTPDMQLLGVLLYGLVSLLPLCIVAVLIANGHKISRIQRWRELNKRFLQFSAGAGLIVLSVYIYTQEVIVTSVAAIGGQ